MIRRRSETKACLVLLLVMALAWANRAAAQDARAGIAPHGPSAGVPLAAASPPITPGDLLEISVFDVPELTHQVRVGPDGKAQLALIGNTELAGLTGQQAAEMIAGELRDRHFLVKPEVSVSIKESTSQGISVTGEVQHPGIYPLLGPRTLLDVISVAGGLTNVADTRITVRHRSTAGDSVTVNLKNDDAKASVASDVQVYPGDLVVVPRAGIVYVLGDVARPGGFVMQDSGRITLLQVLAQAGSVLKTAAADHAILLRKSGEEYVSSKLHVDKIARGKEPDMELEANDIVFIPDSRLKSAAHNAGNIASIASTIGTYAIVH